jgi:hypothetical protein
VSESLILEQIAARVPKVVAEARKQNIGAAGRATYRIERQDIRLVAKPDRLSVEVPLGGNIEVCKPFGGACIRYGQCAARFLAAVTEDVRLTDDYRLPPPSVSVRAERCVLRPVGFDATGELQKIGDDEARKIQRELERARPKMREPVEAAFKAMQRPIDLDGGYCAVFEPDTVSYGALEQSRENLRLNVGVLGTARLTRECSSTNESGATLPKPKRVPALPANSEVELPLELSFESIEPELALALRTLLPHVVELRGSSLGRVTLKATRAPSEKSPGVPLDRVAVELELDGPICGSVWILATPRFEPASETLRLTDAVIDPVSGGNLDEARKAAIANWLLAAPIVLPLRPSQVGDALAKRWQRAKEKEMSIPDGSSLSVLIEESTIKQVHILPQGLRPIVRVTGVNSALLTEVVSIR